MIAPQRQLFDIPRSVAYFNCAYMGPLPLAAARAGEQAALAKTQPWTLSGTDFFEPVEALRASVGALLDAQADDIALIPSASYGLQVAANAIPGGPGRQALVLAEQFPSNVYPWRDWASRTGGEVVTVQRSDEGWTAPLLEAIGPATAVVAIPGCHWTDGSRIDLDAVAARTREVGAALVLDLTQSAGAVPFSAAAIRPDFAVTAGYKWLLGPYAIGYLYVAPWWQTRARPLENNWINRANARDFAALVRYCDDFQDGARRFDVGEKSNFALIPVARAAVEQIAAWTPAAIAATLGAITARIAGQAVDAGWSVLPEAQRSPHMLGLRRSGGLPDDLPARLQREHVHVSVRGDSVRVSPFVYNDLEDEARLLAALRG